MMPVYSCLGSLLKLNEGLFDNLSIVLLCFGGAFSH